VACTGYSNKRGRTWRFFRGFALVKAKGDAILRSLLEKPGFESLGWGQCKSRCTCVTLCVYLRGVNLPSKNLMFASSLA
jgi:hypothetical protein